MRQTEQLQKRILTGSDSLRKSQEKVIRQYSVINKIYTITQVSVFTLLPLLFFFIWRLKKVIFWSKYCCTFYLRTVVWCCLYSLFLEDVQTAIEVFLNMFLILNFVLIVMWDWKTKNTSKIINELLDIIRRKKIK